MSGILAIDMGGSRLRAGLADSAGPANVRAIGDWPVPRALAPFRDQMASLLAETGARRVGIGIPGLAEGTVCRWVPNLGYLDGNDLGQFFPGATVALGNDAQLALVAEAEAGAARGLTDAILIAIGTGIGSAVLSGGRILRGRHGGACSFGWAVADLDDGGDARLGWLERHASGAALDAAARRIGLADGTGLVAAARNGSPEALAALAAPTRAIGAALAGAVALVDPEMIILAGGVAASADVLAPMIARNLRRHLPPHMRAITIRAGTFGPRAGLVGAAIAGARGPDWGQAHG